MQSHSGILKSNKNAIFEKCNKIDKISQLQHKENDDRSKQYIIHTNPKTLKA